MSMGKVEILEILKAHERSFRNGRCSCEEYGRKRTFEEHHEHVAEVLAKHMQEREAEAVRETARYIERLYPRKGLINRADLLADIEIAADRLGRGIHANGRDKRPTNGR